MGLTQSTEEVESAELDLQIDIELDDTAVPPQYTTPGKGAFTIFAPREIVLAPEQWFLVPTGLSFRLPFMLVIVVDSHCTDIVVHREIIDCDYTQELVLKVHNRLPAATHTTYTMKRGEPLALAMVLPVARPGFRLYQPDVERV